jgi:hypothetical protein
MSKPIRPQDIGSAKAEHFTAAVFDAFNAEIAKHFANGQAVVKQSVVVDRLVKAGIARSEIFGAGYLNIEMAYEAAGWKVSYEKPGFNESGDSLFFFRPSQGERDE